MPPSPTGSGHAGGCRSRDLQAAFSLWRFNRPPAKVRRDFERSRKKLSDHTSFLKHETLEVQPIHPKWALLTRAVVVTATCVLGTACGNPDSGGGGGLAQNGGDSGSTASGGSSGSGGVEGGGGMSRPPNIVFILADDLGWADTGVYGSTFHRTPNIDRLASRGMRFQNAYAASPLCSPTRASIMTGQYPGRIGFFEASGAVPAVILEQKPLTTAPSFSKSAECESVSRLKGEYITLAEALKPLGYATGHFGKWHLGAEPYDPLHQGFDVDVPHTSAEGPRGGYLAPWPFLTGFTDMPDKDIEDRMGDEALTFIQAHRQEPFYLNYWAFSVHSPQEGKAALVNKYSALADPGSPQRNPVYAAMIETLDDNVGRLIDAIDAAGLAQDTIIVFTSDNGGVNWTETAGTRINGESQAAVGTAPITSNRPLRGGKATLYEGGIREPLIINWPGKVEAGANDPSSLVESGLLPDVTGCRRGYVGAWASHRWREHLADAERRRGDAPYGRLPRLSELYPAHGERTECLRPRRSVEANPLLSRWHCRC